MTFTHAPPCGPQPDTLPCQSRHRMAAFLKRLLQLTFTCRERRCWLWSVAGEKAPEWRLCAGCPFVWREGSWGPCPACSAVSARTDLPADAAPVQATPPCHAGPEPVLEALPASPLHRGGHLELTKLGSRDPASGVPDSGHGATSPASSALPGLRTGTGRRT